MLSAIIETIRNASGPVTVRYISKTLNLDESAVAGMLDLLIKKGMVRDDSSLAQPAPACHCGGCNGACPASTLVLTPKTFSLAAKTGLKS